MTSTRPDGLVVHQPTGWLVDVENGHIYGARKGSESKGDRLGGPNVHGWWRLGRRTAADGKVRWKAADIIWTVATGKAVPEGHMIDHRNGDRSDLRISNLVCVRRTTGGRLTAAEVQQIRDTAGTLREIAARYGVTPSTVSRIRHGKTHRT